MRRIARTIAASIVVILGLALMSAATFSSNITTATLPEAPKTAAGSDAVAPLDPDADNGGLRNIKPSTPDIFATEFGRRGKHEVTVSMSGPGVYQVHWRDGKVEQGAGRYTRTKTVEGGFPLVRIAVHAGGRSVGCSVTIDGVRKDSQITDNYKPTVVCEG